LAGKHPKGEEVKNIATTFTINNIHNIDNAKNDNSSNN
jgi:hypothetical protein